MYCETILLIRRRKSTRSRKEECFSPVAVVTCQDEDSNKYFEGVTWSADDCTQCTCNGGNINCSRELSLLTSPQQETVRDDCNQKECNVARYVQKNHGVCKGELVSRGVFLGNAVRIYQ